MAMTVTRAQASGTLPAEQWLKVETPQGTSENTFIDSPSANTFTVATGAGTTRVQVNNATTNVANNLVANSVTSLGFVTGTLTLDANSTMKLQNFASLAATGTVIGNAAPVVSQIVYVTASDNTKGIILPTAANGLVIDVYSSVAGKTLKVYPAVNGTIDGGSANAAVVVGPFSYNRFIGNSATNWVGFYQSNVAF